MGYTKIDVTPKEIQRRRKLWMWHYYKRCRRLKRARKLGTHTKKQWLELLAQFDCCPRCGAKAPLAKDHIIPLFCGGSDGIENIQPLCKSCNSSKSDSKDYRVEYLKQKQEPNERPAHDL